MGRNPPSAPQPAPLSPSGAIGNSAGFTQAQGPFPPAGADDVVIERIGGVCPPCPPGLSSCTAPAGAPAHVFKADRQRISEAERCASDFKPSAETISEIDRATYLDRVNVCLDPQGRGHLCSNRVRSCKRAGAGKPVSRRQEIRQAITDREHEQQISAACVRDAAMCFNRAVEAAHTAGLVTTFDVVHVGATPRRPLIHCLVVAKPLQQMFASSADPVSDGG